MTVDVLLLVLGLTLLMGGGEMVVRGSTRLARGLGVSPLAIGLTIVAFGTSAPELAVNLTASLRGRGEICFGNVLGSNMANIGLIIGCVALMRPIQVRGVVISREIPMMLLATTAAIIMGVDRYTGQGPDLFDRGDGLVLLMLLLVFLYYTVGEFVTQRAAYEDGRADEKGPRQGSAFAIRLGLLVTAVGLTALVSGAQITVDAAVDLARAFGVPEVVIGMTVLAVGTSLPELVASIFATVRGHVELAVGNVIGSNIFNLLLVAGFTAIVNPIPVPAGGYLDLLVLGFFSLLLLLASVTNARSIVRAEAVILLGCYAGYLTWRTATSGGL